MPKVFSAKFREILVSGSREIGVSPGKHFSVNRTFSTNYACVVFVWVPVVTKKTLRISGFFASLLFLAYACNKKKSKTINTLRSIMKNNSTDSADSEQIK